jgi:hypothetical protein
MHVHVYAACLCPFCMSVSMLDVHVHAARPWPCCMSMSMFMLHVHFHAVCTCLWYMSIVHAACRCPRPCPFCTSILCYPVHHVYVNAACPRPCCMSMSILYVHVHATCSWSCCMSMPIARPCQCCTSMSKVHVHCPPCPCCMSMSIGKYSRLVVQYVQYSMYISVPTAVHVCLWAEERDSYCTVVNRICWDVLYASVHTIG